MGIHDGNFHADDVFATVTLSLLFGQVSRVFSRDPEALKRCDALVDVGGVYDPENGFFDHHQFKKGECVRENGVPYASFGLVWRSLGEYICGSSEVAQIVDRLLVQSVDANDTGHTIANMLVPGIAVYDISQMIYDFNQLCMDGVKREDAFTSAMVVARRVLENVIARAKNMYPVQVLVEMALGMRENAEILVLLKDLGRDWEFFVCEGAPEVLFVVYPAKDDDWRIRAVPLIPGGFEHRQHLPKTWAGKPQEDLVHLTGAKTAKFCHNLRFIAAAGTREDAIWMAKMAAGLV